MLRCNQAEIEANNPIKKKNKRQNIRLRRAMRFCYLFRNLCTPTAHALIARAHTHWAWMTSANRMYLQICATKTNKQKPFSFVVILMYSKAAYAGPVVCSSYTLNWWSDTKVNRGWASQIEGINIDTLKKNSVGYLADVERTHVKCENRFQRAHQIVCECGPPAVRPNKHARPTHQRRQKKAEEGRRRQKMASIGTCLARSAHSLPVPMHFVFELYFFSFSSIVSYSQVFSITGEDMARCVRSSQITDGNCIKAFCLTHKARSNWSVSLRHQISRYRTKVVLEAEGRTFHVGKTLIEFFNWKIWWQKKN